MGNAEHYAGPIHVLDSARPRSKDARRALIPNANPKAPNNSGVGGPQPPKSSHIPMQAAAPAVRPMPADNPTCRISSRRSPRLGEPAVADGLLHQGFLAMLALEVEVGGALLRSGGPGMGDEFSGFAFQEGQEVGAAPAEDTIHEAVEVRLVATGQMPLEDHAIQAGQNSDKGSSKLGDQRIRRLHGVLLRCVVRCSNTLPGERRWCFGLLGCGFAALGQRCDQGLARCSGNAGSAAQCPTVLPAG
jgi:hypothetical protein